MILDGKAVADRVLEKVKAEIEKYKFRIRLSVILCTDDPASKIYVDRKIKTCESVGIQGRLLTPHKTGWGWSHRKHDLLTEEIQMANDHLCDGILLQLPLPKDMNKRSFLNLINPLKDVDVFTSVNVGLLLQGTPRFLPCTPAGIRQMFIDHGIVTEGKKVVIVNRSDVVGKPLQAMLIQDDPQFGNATVAMCHDHTPPATLKETCLWADIIIVAVGIRNFLTADMVRPGAVVVDVGINRDESGKVCGDVDFGPVAEKSAWISPVPGGVGPCTVAMLMKNTLSAHKQLNDYWD